MRRTVSLCFLLGALVRGGLALEPAGPRPLLAFPPEDLTLSRLDVETDLRLQSEQHPALEEAMAPLARSLIHQGRFDEAVLEIRKMAALPDLETAFLEAEAEYFQGRTEVAREHIASLSEDSKHWIAARALRARIEWLEGDLDATTSICLQLTSRTPNHHLGRLLPIRVHLRRGELAEAERELDEAEILFSDDLQVIEARSRWLEAKGDVEGAEAANRRILDQIRKHPPARVEDLTAACAALRRLGEPKAANQCLQLARRWSPADPFVILEQARLFAQRWNLSESWVAARRLVRTYEHFGEPLEILGDLVWDLKRDVSVATEYYSQAIRRDPLLTGSRNRLVFYDLVAREWDKARGRLDENRRHKPGDRETEIWATVLSVLESSVPSDDSPTSLVLAARSASGSARRIGEVFLVRSDLGSAAEWFEHALTSDASCGPARHGLGLTRFRSGDFSGAREVLETVFAADRFDIETRNLLELLDTLCKSEIRSAGVVRIGHRPQERDLALYTAYLTNRFLEHVEETLALGPLPDLQLQVCRTAEDLFVGGTGFPVLGCGQSTTGEVHFERLGLVADAGTLQGTFRYDECLARCLAHLALQGAYGRDLPLWLREGLTGYCLSSFSPDFRPVGTDVAVARLRVGAGPPIEDLEAALVRNSDAGLRAYAALLVEAWIDRVGWHGVRGVVDQMTDGTDWKPILAASVQNGLEEWNRTMQTSVLERYADLRFRMPVRASLRTLTQVAQRSEAGELALARFFIDRRRFDEALGLIDPMLQREAPPTEAMFLAAHGAFGQSRHDEARDRFRAAQELDRFRDGRVAVARDLEVLAWTLEALGDQRGALDAIREAIELNLWADARPHADFLLKQLEKTEEAPDWLDALLERRPICLKDRVALRLAWADRHLEAGREREAFDVLRSTAGINPRLAPVQRRLALLARQIGESAQARASAEMVLTERPDDAVMRSLLEDAP